MGHSSLAVEVIPANPKHTGGSQSNVDLIVVHATVSACVPGGARNNARYFQREDAGGAAHYVVDPGSIVSCVDELVVAHHAPPNTGSVGVELTDWQGMGPDHNPDLWDDQPHQQMLGLGSKLVADIATRHPLVRLEWRSVDDLKAGRRGGVASHANVAKAYRKSNHTDPGEFFPVEHFMSLVTGSSEPVDPHPQEPEVTFIAEFLDEPGTLWLCDVAATGNGDDHDPTHKYGTRTRVIDPPTLLRLAALGVPVRSGQQQGMELFKETV